MATPIGTRAASGDVVHPASGEVGNCSRIANAVAESMNSPRQHASLTYSGQCLDNACMPASMSAHGQGYRVGKLALKPRRSDDIQAGTSLSDARMSREDDAWLLRRLTIRPNGLKRT